MQVDHYKTVLTEVERMLTDVRVGTIHAVLYTTHSTVYTTQCKLHIIQCMHGICNGCMDIVRVNLPPQGKIKL